MQKPLRFLAIAAVIGVFAITGLSALPQESSADPRLAEVKASGCPVLRLKHWQASTRDEKMAFLFGFASMVEMEKEWQHNKPLSIRQSTVGTWVRGLDGVTLGQMCDSLDRYVAEHPGEMERSVLEVLGRIYVRPKMSAGERQEAAARVEEIRRGR